MRRGFPTDLSEIQVSETVPSQDMVRWIVSLILCTTLASVVLLPFSEPSLPLWMVVAGVGPFVLICVVSLSLNGSGRVVTGANLFIWGTYLGQLGVLFGARSFETQALISFVNLVLCAGFMMGRGSALRVGLAILVAVTGSYTLDNMGLLPPPLWEGTPSAVFVSMLCTLAATVGLTYMGIRFTGEALKRAQMNQVQAEEALLAREAAARADAGRAAQAERLAAMARAVVALRNPQDIAHEVARGLSEGLDGVQVLILDQRGHVLTLSGVPVGAEDDPPTLFLAETPSEDGFTRRLSEAELSEISEAIGQHLSGEGRLFVAPRSQVVMIVVGEPDAVGGASAQWQLDTASHLLATGVHRIYAEQALAQSQRMDALGRMAAGIAHDFNNLLTTILGGTELVGTRIKGDAEAQKYVDALRTAAERAAGLTTKLMAFASSASEGPRLVEVVGLVENLLPVLRRSVAESIELDVVLPEEEAWVLADPVDLERALLNLVVNARDALEDRGEIEVGVEIRCSAKKVDRKGVVVIWVDDSGPGISSELHSKVFEPFFSTRRHQGASGLGLSIVYGVVQAMGGEVMLASEPGSGTRVELLLPQQASGAPAVLVGQDILPIPADQRILVVEDDPDVRDTICEMLGVGGYRVFACQNGEAALAALDKDGPFSLVLSDVVMPQMGGFELARRILERDSPPPMALVSGYAPTAQPNEVIATIPMISKPFTLKRLLDFVGELVI